MFYEGQSIRSWIHLVRRWLINLVVLNCCEKKMSSDRKSFKKSLSVNTSHCANSETFLIKKIGSPLWLEGRPSIISLTALPVLCRIAKPLFYTSRCITRWARFELKSRTESPFVLIWCLLFWRLLSLRWQLKSCDVHNADSVSKSLDIFYSL